MQVVFNNIPIKASWEDNQWLMKLIRGSGFNQEELRRINRVRLHHQVLFFCVVGASGKTLAERYLKRRRPNENRLQLKFPKENPPRRDFTLCEQALQQLFQTGRIMIRLGRFRRESCTFRMWYHVVPTSRLLNLKVEIIDVYSVPARITT